MMSRGTSMSVIDCLPKVQYRLALRLLVVPWVVISLNYGPAMSAEVTSGGSPDSIDGRGGLALQDFRPQSTLRVPSHVLTRAKFPVIDVQFSFSVSASSLQRPTG